MKVVNKTRFLTSDLRHLFCLALRADEKSNGKMHAWQKSKLTVHVVQLRQCRKSVSGYAYLNGTLMRLRLPESPIVESVVWVFLHELAHIRGHEHKNMSDKILRDMASEIVTTIPNFVLRKKQTSTPKPKVKQPIQLIRYEHAKNMLSRKEKELIKLKRLISKWHRKVRYYERTLKDKINASITI